MTTKRRLIATSIAVIIITAAIATAKIEGSRALAIVVAVAGIAGFIAFIAAWNQRLRRQP
jgi:hypothetical protein